ncbi:FGGY family carbohydrate kinase [Aestuariivirga litoralis]|uniref:FGGY family carbohydrate kinase n=1 Tax=Aestuariivirga litoralis TaxID=2650924 RepID=UPI0018C50170|nr:FGGY family carbohydrate kinase [Aestuariivirga litoralis]MBG1232712.1 glycerol kinase [Aestuariivirga litoralis]
MKVLAIDQGTTGTKAFTYDSDGNFNQVFSAEVTQYFPEQGWVEHDAEELLAHIGMALEKAGQVDAIGIANQGETLLAWDATTGIPIYRAIVWQDDRSKDFCEALKGQGAEALTKSKAGLPLDPYFSASKFRWLLDHVPEARPLLKQGRLHMGTSDAFFLERLTGEFVTDVTTASRTSLMSLDTLQWDAELCDLFGVPMQCLPEIRATTGPFGKGITASMVDQQAALFGHGCMKPGDGKITFGTGAFALALAGPNRPQQDQSGLLPTVAWKIGQEPAVYALDGGVYNAASAVNWAKSLKLFADYAEINTFEAAPAIARKLAFVPALSGLACPHWDRNATGLWIGLGLDTTARDMMQAVLEGVALRACEVVEAMSRHGRSGAAISIDGGLSKNPYFGQFLSNALGRMVTVASTADLTGLGVARMAMVGAGAAHLPPLPAPSQLYSPSDPLPAALHSRFGIAVLRAKGWKAF